MAGDHRVSLEKALAKTESDAVAAFKAATITVSSLKKFRAAAHKGDLRELQKTIDATGQALTALGQQFTNAKEGWEDFDVEHYFEKGLYYSQELVATAKQMGVRIDQREERLYCHPALIRVSHNEKAVFIDKKRENGIRPSVLVARLKELQRKPPRFRSESFLKALFDAYSKAVAMRGKDRLQKGTVVPLLDIYELFTLLPGQTREYSTQEFARDIYLLHRSDVNTTKTGERVSFPASTGTKTLTRTISVITEEGEENRYYGICFT